MHFKTSIFLTLLLLEKGWLKGKAESLAKIFIVFSESLIYILKDRLSPSSYIMDTR